MSWKLTIRTIIPGPPPCLCTTWKWFAEDAYREAALEMLNNPDALDLTQEDRVWLPIRLEREPLAPLPRGSRDQNASGGRKAQAARSHRGTTPNLPKPTTPKRLEAKAVFVASMDLFD